MPNRLPLRRLHQNVDSDHYIARLIIEHDGPDTFCVVARRLTASGFAADTIQFGDRLAKSDATDRRASLARHLATFLVDTAGGHVLVLPKLEFAVPERTRRAEPETISPGPDW